MKSKILFSASLILLASCGDNTPENKKVIDITQYMIPSTSNNNTTHFFDAGLLSRKEIESKYRIDEYSNNLVTQTSYSVWSSQATKKYSFPQSVQKDYKYTINYNLHSDIIEVSKKRESGNEKKYNVKRFLVEGEHYKNTNTGTFEETSNEYNNTVDVVDTFSLTKQSNSECLIHNREYTFDKESKNEEKVNHEYVYCKPYGLVSSSVYEKNGNKSELLKRVQQEKLDIKTNQQSKNDTSVNVIDTNPSLTFSCFVDISIDGKSKRYMNEQSTWEQVITDNGTWFSWDLPRGNSGNSTGQDMFNGMEDSAPDLRKKLVRKSTEEDGSLVDELQLTDVKDYSEDAPKHTIVYTRKIQSNGIREYYVKNHTNNRSWIFWNCKLDE